MKRYRKPMRRTLPASFSASLLQIRRAYERHYGRPVPPKETFQAIGNAMVADLGLDKARALILAEPNDATAPEPLADRES